MYTSTKALVVVLSGVVWLYGLPASVQVTSVVGAFTYAVLESSWYTFWTSQPFTTLEQFYLNLLWLPVAINAFRAWITPLTLRLLLYPLNFWLLEIACGYYLMWLFRGYNVAWDYSEEDAPQNDPGTGVAIVTRKNCGILSDKFNDWARILPIHIRVPTEWIVAGILWSAQAANAIVVRGLLDLVNACYLFIWCCRRCSGQRCLAFEYDKSTALCAGNISLRCAIRWVGLGALVEAMLLFGENVLFEWL